MDHAENHQKNLNTTYFFVPFKFEDPASFSHIVGLVRRHRDWTCVHDKIKYMLKFVADKIDSTDEENCQCFHFQLNKGSWGKYGLGTENTLYHMNTHAYHGSDENFPFYFQSIQMYIFSTSVCILAFQVQFTQKDPLWISCAQYFAKKVSREPIYSPLASEESPSFTLLSLANSLTDGLKLCESFSFFYYANPSTERANAFSLIEVEPKPDYKQELFFLRRCYSDGFLYTENPVLDEREIYSPSSDTFWGISPEAAVCLICPDMGRRAFLEDTFYTNFNAQYLFMYVLLLHQKYVLYMFLTMIGVGTRNDLDTLETYRRRLYEFETDFVFSCVTETPQYQNLYEKMSDAFSLKQMYEDVREPLTSLSEVRRVHAENKQKDRDKAVNRSLIMLSLLSFFSALIDSFDFANSFLSWFFNESVIRGFQIFLIFGIFAVLIYTLINLFSSEGK